MTDFMELSARRLVEGYQTGEISPVEVTEAALKRINDYNEAVNAFVFVDEYTKEKYHETARAEAKASEERWHKGEAKGLIDGVPITVKDVFITKDWPTRKGSKATSNKLYPEDAPPVQQLYEHGAVLLGKTTTPEFAYKGVTDGPLTGITCNPWNLDRTSGGSSGGAAVAAAMGFGTLHLSSDGGGSTRLPGAFTGGVGFKSTEPGDPYVLELEIEDNPDGSAGFTFSDVRTFFGTSMGIVEQVVPALSIGSNTSANPDTPFFAVQITIPGDTGDPVLQRNDIYQLPGDQLTLTPFAFSAPTALNVSVLPISGYLSLDQVQ